MRYPATARRWWECDSRAAVRELRRQLLWVDVRPWNLGPGGPPEASPFGADDLTIWSALRSNTFTRTGWHDDGFARDWPIDPELVAWGGGLDLAFTPR